MKYIATVNANAEDPNEKGIYLELQEEDLTKMMTLIEVVLRRADRDASVYIRRVSR